MQILLVQPDQNPGPVSFRAVAMPEPLALEVLAALVPDHEVHILDLRVDPDLDHALALHKPDLVAVTSLTVEVYAARQILQRVKEHSAHVFTAVGGHHATLLPEDFQLPYVDAICLGEGEFVFPALVDAVEMELPLRDVPNLVWRDADGAFVSNGRHVPKADGDLVPHPRRDLVADYRHAYFWLFEKPDTAIATGRGCPFRCDFCSVWQFYQGQTRQMSATRVLEEIRSAGTQHVTFVDDNFMLNARRDHEIADLILAEGLQLRWGMECRTDSIARHPELIEKWAGLGLRLVLLGLEGISDDALDRVNKHNTAQTNDEAIRILQANGVMIWGAFIVHPDWTADQFTALHDYVHKSRIACTQFTVLTPLPGTRLYRERRADLLTQDYTCFDTLHAVLPTRLPREEFYQHLASLYLKPNLDFVYEDVRQGRLTVEQVRHGHQILRHFGRWEAYGEGDPVLRRARPCTTEGLSRP
ncbi:MAG: cobalamin-dependent protein [Phycisphaerae bacterium]|nr:cobalamin-dependent protein [Phycisphaerae bacterium]